MGVLFNFIPGSGVVAPGTFFEVNSAGKYASNFKTLVLGHKASAGTLTDNTPTLCSTVEEAALLAGVGSQLYETFREARAKAPLQEIWVASIPSSGSAAAWTIAVGTLAAAGGTGILEIAGRKIPLTVAAGESAATTATNLAAAINAWVDAATKQYLPVTATVSTNTVTVTARHTGAAMNEIEITADSGLAGNIFSTSNLTITQTVTAAGTAAVATALAALGDDYFDAIISPFGDTTNCDSADAVLSDLSGRWAWNVQLYGHYFTVNTGSTSQNTTYGLARNSRHVSALARVASPTPSWEWLGAYVGIQLSWLLDDTNGNAPRNQSGRALENIRPPRARASWPNLTVRNTLLSNGMSTWSVNGAGQVCVDKCITMSRLNSAGQPDATFRNVQTIFVAAHGLRYLRAGLSYRHTNKSLALYNPNNVPAISTPRDIAADLVEIYGDLVDRGMFQDRAGFAKALVVEIDGSNSARVNIGANKMKQVSPLDILAASAFISI